MMNRMMSISRRQRKNIHRTKLNKYFTHNEAQAHALRSDNDI